MTAPAAIRTALTLLAARCLLAQTVPLSTPVVTAVEKGPDQINLTWPAVPNPGYGYLVEIQSAADARYSAWTELRPIPPAHGYNCDTTVAFRNGYCNISDPDGRHTYSPPNRGIPYWVTESNYVDPQDDSPAQFIASGLKPDTTYNFRVRVYSGDTHGKYSAQVTAKTANYHSKYVSPEGKDANDGSDAAHAWRTLAHATSALHCGEVLIALGGDYPQDIINLRQTCTANAKAVVLANPGDTVKITSAPAGAEHVLLISGAYDVIDGVKFLSSSPQNGEYDGVVDGHHNALFDVEIGPPTVPVFKGGLAIHGANNLLYQSYLHDYGSPDATQNPNGNGGFVLAVLGAGARNNIFWSNHLTRGGHDVSLCKEGCNYNRWLNNIMDGGWGMGWEAIEKAERNLLEGSVIKDVGQLVGFYKPAIEVSAANNTVRRNVVIRSRQVAMEVSDLYNQGIHGVLVYNNTFYRPGSCYFQSRSGGVAAYDGGVYSNNICYKIAGNATDIYQPNKNSEIANNSITVAGADGALKSDPPVIIWNHVAEGDFQYPKTLHHADSNYSPPFSHNKGLDVEAKFVAETRSDFHLVAGSPLIAAGKPIADQQWGGVTGKPDVGAFGIKPSPHATAAVRTAKADAEPAAAMPIVAGKTLQLGTPRFDPPTPTTLGIQLPISGDDNFNALVTVRYREAGTQVWRDALPLFRVHPEVVSGWGVAPQFAGSIFDLKPGATYEIQLHAIDPDGPVDQTVTLTGATRPLPADPATPRPRAVRTAQELTAALAAAQPGDIITLADGTYSGPFQISAAGTRENPIVIRGSSPEGAVLDGAGCKDCNVLEVSGPGFIHIERLTIRNGQRAIRFQTEGADSNVVRRVHVRETTLGITGNFNQKDFYMCDNTLEGRLQFPHVYSSDQGAHSDDDGIMVRGTGHAVCHNQISGYGDAMKTDQRGARGIDFYGNDIRFTYDNGLELDEASGNVRCFRNRFLNTYAPLSVQPIYGGPAYMFRNVVVNVFDEQMKFHALGGDPPQEPSGILALHNTFVSPGLSLNLQTPAMSHFFLIANNLFIGPKAAGIRKIVDWDGPIHSGVFDYNGYYPDGIFSINYWKNKRQYSTVRALEPYGIEPHGMALGVPLFQSNFSIGTNFRSFVQPADFSLAPGSAAIDRAIYLPNIGDGFAGAAPDLGAIESGCPAPIYGPRPEGIDESNQTHACPPRSDPPSAEPAVQLIAKSWSEFKIAPPSTRRAPRAIAEEALLAAASGNLDAAFAYFTPESFPQPKQEDAVREAYFDLQLQAVLKLSAENRCPEADRAITNLGYEDKRLPFTFNGFGSYMKRLRVQYLLGTIEAACVDQKSARKRFEKIAKSSADSASPEYVYPYLAQYQLDAAGVRDKVSAALEAIKKSLPAAKTESKGVLYFQQGVLLSILGKTEDAAASLWDGVHSSTGMAQYLNLEVLRSLETQQ
jgi:hypothetical protein